MKRGLIISFLQMKGGVGKSTLSQNLAVSFANEGISVKIIDSDVRQRTCSKWHARRNEYQSNKAKISCSIQVDDLKSAIIEESAKYDVVIIDLQGRDSKSLRITLLLSDIIYIPFTPSQHDMETIEELAELLEETQMQNEARKTFYILNNCSSHYLDKDQEDAISFLDEYKHLIMPSQAKIFHRKIYKKASSEGLGVVETSDQKAIQEIIKLKEEVKNNV